MAAIAPAAHSGGTVELARECCRGCRNTKETSRSSSIPPGFTLALAWPAPLPFAICYLPFTDLPLALVWLWGRIGVALGWLWWSLEVALGCLWGAYQLAINTLWGGFDVALMSHWGGLPSPPTAFLLSAFYFLLSPRGGFARFFCIHHSSFFILHSSSAFRFKVPLSTFDTRHWPRLPRQHKCAWFPPDAGYAVTRQMALESKPLFHPEVLRQQVRSFILPEQTAA